MLGCALAGTGPSLCRELAHMYAPLSMVAMPDLKECLGRLKEHQVGRACPPAARMFLIFCALRHAASPPKAAAPGLLALPVGPIFLTGGALPAAGGGSPPRPADVSPASRGLFSRCLTTCNAPWPSSPSLQHPEVKQLAAGVLDQWLRIAVAQASACPSPAGGATPLPPRPASAL